MKLFWQLLPSVRPTERDRFLFFMTLSGLVILAQTLGLVGAESLLLAKFGAELLPPTFVVASVVTVLGSLVYAVGVDRSRNDSYFIAILVTLATIIGGLSYGAYLEIRWTYPALFCLYYLALAVLMNHYWTFTGDYFDTLAAKRLFPLFTVGASLGGLVGGVVASVISSANLLLGAWVVSLLAAAVFLRMWRRQLRRWGPLELEEADETSFSGMQAALRYLRQSALGRWLMGSAIAMVLSLFVLQYLYSDILAREYPKAEDLAQFLGIFLALTNLLEIFLEVSVAPFLINRLGVAAANVVHPVLTVLSFAFLAVDYALAAAIMARVNRETIENAISGPIRNLVYNALPARFRGRMRAFLEGMVVYTGMAAAGVGLLILQGRLDPFWLSLAGGLTAVVYTLANLIVRREYLRTLVAELRAGRLDLEAIGSDVGAFELSRLAEVWRRLLREGAPPKTILPLIPTFATQEFFQPLKEGLGHADSRIRKACLEALGAHDPVEFVNYGRLALRDPNPEVRLVAVQAFPTQTNEFFASLLEDSDLKVRAQACLRYGEKGRLRLEQMLASQQPEQITAALEALPPELVDELDQLADHQSPAVRAKTLSCYARHRVSGRSLDQLRLHLRSSHAGERKAALELLALRSQKDEEALSQLALGLQDEHREVRQQTAELLASLDDDRGLRVAANLLPSESLRTATAAVETFTHRPRTDSRDYLNEELRHRVREAWKLEMALHLVPVNGDTRRNFLRLSLENAARNHRFLAFRMLEAVEGSSLIRSVEKVLRFANSRVRADALEVLSNLGDREAASLLVLMLEEGPVEDKLPLVRTQVEGPETLDQVEQLARQSQNRWIQMAAEGALEDSGETVPREELMEHLLVLRQVPLFSQMTLEQLEAINQLLSEEQYLAKELIFREGDVGDELYIVVEGEVGIFINHGSDKELLLTTVRDGNYFGEMAILDDEPRSASVQALEQTRLLVLKGEQLKELVFQMPEIAFEIFKVLTGRIRRSDQRLDELSKATAETE